MSAEHLIAFGVRKISEASEWRSFHSFRVNVITQLTDNDADTIQVMKIVGHSAGQVRTLSTHLG